MGWWVDFVFDFFFKKNLNGLTCHFSFQDQNHKTHHFISDGYLFE